MPYKDKEEKKSHDKQYSKRYYQLHTEEQIARVLEYQKKPEYKKWRNIYLTAYIMNRRHTDVQFYLGMQLRTLLYQALNRYGNGKNHSSKKYGLDLEICCKKLTKL